MIWCVFHEERRVTGRIVAPPWMSRFRLCCRDGVDTGWFLDDFTSCGIVVERKTESDPGGGVRYPDQ